MAEAPGDEDGLLDLRRWRCISWTRAGHLGSERMWGMLAMAHEIAMVARRADGLLTRAAVLTVFDVSWIVPVDDDNVEVATKFLVLMRARRRRGRYSSLATNRRRTRPACSGRCPRQTCATSCANCQTDPLTDAGSSDTVSRWHLAISRSARARRLWHTSNSSTCGSA